LTLTRFREALYRGKTSGINYSIAFSAMNDLPLILIVDDDPNVLTVLVLAFRDRGWRVVTIGESRGAI
jgi:hypothetical protein